MIGTVLGRYRIVAKLGEGGMGSVWRAEDPALGRTVALKLLAPALLGSDAARQRFLREARAASALDHPAIATVYDVGESDGTAWIACRFVDGESVAARCAAGPLAIAAAVTVARETAAALAHAHERGVLHRDVTAGNVMVTRDGHAVLVDFGLARPEQATHLTSTGAMMGTAGYMAPEVLRGAAADARSDLYGLGAVLYKMLTGRLPFEGGPPEAMLYRALSEPVPPPSETRPEIPPALERVVLKLLAREPADRLRDAAETETALVEAAGAAGPTASEQKRRAAAKRLHEWSGQLRRLARARVGVVALGTLAVLITALWFAAQRGWLPGTAKQPRVLAVLPMRNTSSDAEGTAHFGEALGEELVRRIGSSRAFRVLPWVTTVRHGDARESPVELSRLLHADLLLMGSFRFEGDRLEVHAELVDGRSGLQSWSEKYMRPEGELIALQSDLATGVSEQVAPQFGREERKRLAASAPSNPEAYKYFIMASNYWHSGDPATLSLVEPFFRRAVELDSTLAEAWVGLGAVLVDRHYRGEAAGRPEMMTAKSMFERALRLHPGLPAAERGLIRAVGELDDPEQHDLGRDRALAALERNSTDIEQLLVAIWGFNLGQLPELALPPINRVLTLDPSNQAAHFYKVMALAWSIQPQRCLAAGAEYTRKFGEDLEVYGYMSDAAFALGQDEEAVLLGRRAIELNSNAPAHQSVYSLARIYLATGDTLAFRTLLRDRLPDLEARYRAQPDNPRLELVLQTLYELARDEPNARRVMAMFRPTPIPEPPWSALARFGHLQEAIATLRTLDATRSPGWSLGTPELVDSLGLLPRPEDPRLEALFRTPEFRAYLAAIDRVNLSRFNRYRNTVAQYFPDDPDLPPPRTAWPRNPLR